jgi:hypothetical protein
MFKVNANQYLINSLVEQYGAAFKTLENIITNCPEDLWENTSKGPPFYKIIYHTMFFIDLYRSSTQEERTSFTPRFEHAEDFRNSKENFHPSEWKDALSKNELLDYLSYIRINEQKRIENLTLHRLISEPIFEWHGSTILSSMIYNLRHIMLHIGALQGRLRMHGCEERYWVSQSPILE